MSNSNYMVTSKKNGKHFNDNDIISIFNSLIESKKEYEMTKQVESTKRYEIQERTKSYLETLHVQEKAMEDILKNQFKQRQEAIDKMFESIDKALEVNKDEIVIAALNNITEIVKSPIKTYSTMKHAFENDDEDLVL